MKKPRYILAIFLIVIGFLCWFTGIVMHAFPQFRPLLIESCTYGGIIVIAFGILSLVLTIKRN